jgi:hypothetical protein
MTVAGHPPPPDECPEPAGPRDNPFLERLFAAMCRSVYVLPGETFVDQARRWMAALRAMAALDPRDEREWLLASDVAMKHLFAEHSLILSKAKGVRVKQRQRHGNEFIVKARNLHAAQLRYDLARGRSGADSGGSGQRR